jgi:hypothetical protein
MMRQRKKQLLDYIHCYWDLFVEENDDLDNEDRDLLVI